MDFILDLTMCLADYDLRERIHNPVSVSEVLGRLNDKPVLNKNIFFFIPLCLLIHNINSE